VNYNKTKTIPKQQQQITKPVTKTKNTTKIKIYITSCRLYMMYEFDHWPLKCQFMFVYASGCCYSATEQTALIQLSLLLMFIRPSVH